MLSFLSDSKNSVNISSMGNSDNDDLDRFGCNLKDNSVGFDS